MKAASKGKKREQGVRISTYLDFKPTSLFWAREVNTSRKPRPTSYELSENAGHGIAGSLDLSNTAKIQAGVAGHQFQPQCYSGRTACYRVWTWTRTGIAVRSQPKSGHQLYDIGIWIHEHKNLPQNEYHHQCYAAKNATVWRWLTKLQGTEVVVCLLCIWWANYGVSNKAGHGAFASHWGIASLSTLSQCNMFKWLVETVETPCPHIDVQIWCCFCLCNLAGNLKVFCLFQIKQKLIIRLSCRQGFAGRRQILGEQRTNSLLASSHCFMGAGVAPHGMLPEWQITRPGARESKSCNFPTSSPLLSFYPTKRTCLCSDLWLLWHAQHVNSRTRVYAGSTR